MRSIVGNVLRGATRDVDERHSRGTKMFCGRSNKTKEEGGGGRVKLDCVHEINPYCWTTARKSARNGRNSALLNRVGSTLGCPMWKTFLFHLQV